MPDNETVGNRIRQLRADLGLTQRELASMVGVLPSAIANYESGERIPRDEIKQRIADIGDRSVEEIFFTNVRHDTRQKGHDHDTI